MEARCLTSTSSHAGTANLADWAMPCLAMHRARLCARETSAGSSSVRDHCLIGSMSQLTVRVFAVSEKHNNLQPVVPYDISVSPTGHVLLTLDTLAHSGPGATGRDILAWGASYDYQLGNGKRGSVPTPTNVADGDGERFMLGKRRAGEVRDLQGKLWKKNIEVEQKAVAGWGNSIVYWKIYS